MTARAAPLLCALAVAAGCGSGTPLPPAAEPARSPPQRATPAGRIHYGAPLPAVPAPRLSDGAAVRLDPRRRRLVVERPGGETLSAPAGIGPTHAVVGADDRIYVTDTGGGAVLLMRVRPELRIVRRAALPGRPYALAIDRRRGKLWVTVTETNEVVQLTADGEPRIQRRLPSVRQPNALAVEGDELRVLGAQGELQVFDLDSPAG